MPREANGRDQADQHWGEEYWKGNSWEGYGDYKDAKMDEKTGATWGEGVVVPWEANGRDQADQHWGEEYWKGNSWKGYGDYKDDEAKMDEKTGATWGEGGESWEANTMVYWGAETMVCDRGPGEEEEHVQPQPATPSMLEGNSASRTLVPSEGAELQAIPYRQQDAALAKPKAHPTHERIKLASRCTSSRNQARCAQIDCSRKLE